MTSLLSAWYVVHSKPRQEEATLAQLQRQELFEVYLPLFRVFAKPGRRVSPSPAHPAETK